MLLACCFSGKAQTGYFIRHFTTDNGLPSNGIKGLQWDEQTGFLWVATEAGIARFNGADFHIFNRSNTPGMLSERMLFLLKTLDGRIYSSDEAGNLFFIEKNKVVCIGHTVVDTRPAVFKLTGLVASGRLFRQTSLQTPAEFGFYFTREQLVPLSENRMVMTHNDTLYDYRLGKPQPVFLTTLASGSKIFYLNRTLFIFHPQQGCFRINPDSPRKIPVAIATIKDDRDQERLFWDEGMNAPILVKGPNAWTLTYRDGDLQPHLICSGVPQNDLLSFVKYDSSTGLFFAGTLSKGILIIRGQAARSVGTPRTPPGTSTAYYNQIRLKDGDILTNNGQIITGQEPIVRRSPITGHFNNFSLLEPDSTLWYSLGDTIHSYSFKTGRITTVYSGAGSITVGFLRSGGSLYVASAVGIGPLKDGQVDYQYRYRQSNANGNVPDAMAEISPGLIAIATCKGLLRFNTATHRVDTLLRIPGICVRALWQFKGYLFVGTYGRGIWLYKNGHLGALPLDKNGHLQYAHCFFPDSLGYCWISTNHGLFRARPDEMIEAFEHRRSHVFYYYYGRDDGMNTTELNGGCSPCALRLNDTTISFPSMDGLVWVDPSHPIPVSPKGSIFLDGFWADSERIDSPVTNLPELSPDTRELRFDLAFPAWQDKENIFIDYKLLPWSGDWQPMNLQRGPELRFSNLPYGHYRLLIRNSNGSDFKDATIMTSSFSILPHWYQETWWRGLGLALLCALVFGIVRWRTGRLKKRQVRLERQIAEKTRELQTKNEELERSDLIKTRLISIISHDLITPLHYIHLAGKNLLEMKNGLNETLQDATLAEMTTTTKELELLSTNILNWIKFHNEDRRLAKEDFDLNALVTQLFSVLGVLARQKDVQLINEIPGGLFIYQYVEPVRIVLYNLILNAINFTTRGSIRVGCAPASDGIRLLVTDTGVGMTPDQINNIMADHFIISSANVDNRKGNGLGYLIVKDLLKMLRGNLNIRSSKESGTTVAVYITT